MLSQLLKRCAKTYSKLNDSESNFRLCIGATYEQVASFFSTALHTKVSEARIKQFAQSPPSTVIQLADQKRLFALSSDMTIPPDGQIHARILHVKYGRQLRKEADRRMLDE